jgi:regulator of protease activity HflC (stomatin/prohibitin superfamily)
MLGGSRPEVIVMLTRCHSRVIVIMTRTTVQRPEENDMADIKRFPIARHLRATATSYVIHTNAGAPRHAGAGTAFWFRALSAALSEIPIDDRELPLMAHARTADLQDVAVAVTVSFRFTDPATVAQRIDFGISPDTGAWTGSPLEQVAQLLTESATGLVMDSLAGLTLVEAVTAGAGELGSALRHGLQTDERLDATGITVLGARVRAVRAEADMERALQTPARELAQTEADAATNTRRALAVDRERTIAENELANRIELATREQQLVVQEGANARRRAEEVAAAALVEATAVAERDALAATTSATSTRQLGEAQAAAEAAKLAAYSAVDTAVLTALALRELAANLPEIGQLTITPDLLSRLLTGMGARPVGARES